jgi:4a-hydroxytetrahydrobiopterin dehydratase
LIRRRADFSPIPADFWNATPRPRVSEMRAAAHKARPITPGTGQMNESLQEKSCTPCRGGLPPLTREEAEHFHTQAPDWRLDEEARRIARSFHFADFQTALVFVDAVGGLAETEGHHPDIHFGWGYATVFLQTKKIKGLHENDFIMATKIDRLFAQTSNA